MHDHPNEKRFLTSAHPTLVKIEDLPPRNPMIRSLLLILTATLILNGCALFGCAGIFGNGGGAGGCTIGTRF
jgi:hypothetical protein